MTVKDLIDALSHLDQDSDVEDALGMAIIDIEPVDDEGVVVLLTEDDK